MSAEPSVQVRSLARSFGEVAAVDGVSLEIRRGELFSLVGPSGCGKTTLLRLIAGLEEPTAGTIAIDGEEVTHLPPHRRPVNLVFQHYALFPHLAVAENVAFGLRYQGLSRAAAADRVERALALVRLEGYGGRRPHQLSGGQRQRVALARALALEPRVLLLDEPLAALDPALRRQVQGELKALQRSLGITFLLVTHDQQEALALSDRMAVMNRGRVEQVGTAAEVYEAPETAFVASFLGASNSFAGEVLRLEGGHAAVRLAAGPEVSVPHRPGGPVPGDAVRVVVRPERMRLFPGLLPGGPPPAGEGGREVSVPVAVEERVYQGASTLWGVRDGAGERFSVSVPNGGAAVPECRMGEPALLAFRGEDAVLVREGAE